jgi:ABC-2 type transport system ATP-binding protein
MAREAIRIRGLAKRFSKFQLGPLDFTVPTGAIYGLIGPNGAGKTTTLDLIMGMGKKDAGSIEVFGLDHGRNEVAIKRQIGYVGPDLSFNAWGRVNRLLSFVRTFYQDWDDAYCTDLLHRLNIGLHDRISTLSFGARTKLSLVIALAHRPALLLLDEPLAGLDVISKQEVFAELLRAVQDEDRTVVISSHDLHDLERLTDHIGVIHAGKLLIEGPTAELVERFRMVDCIAPDSPTPETIPGIRTLHWEGGRLRLLADLRHDALQSLESLDAKETVITPVTLEELFLALIRSSGHAANHS